MFHCSELATTGDLQLGTETATDPRTRAARLCVHPRCERGPVDLCGAVVVSSGCDLVCKVSQEDTYESRHSAHRVPRMERQKTEERSEERVVQVPRRRRRKRERVRESKRERERERERVSKRERERERVREERERERREREREVRERERERAILASRGEERGEWFGEHLLRPPLQGLVGLFPLSLESGFAAMECHGDRRPGRYTNTGLEQKTPRSVSWTLMVSPIDVFPRQAVESDALLSPSASREGWLHGEVGAFDSHEQGAREESDCSGSRVKRVLTRSEDKVDKAGERHSDTQ